MAGIRWTEQENKIMRENYTCQPKESMKKLLPKRTWDAIKLRAEKLKLNFDTVKYNVTKLRMFNDGDNQLGKLLEDTHEALYWVGFILADGHISKKYRLVITLAEKDKEHLEKFCKFINYNCNSIRVGDNGKFRAATIAIQDENIIKNLAEKYHIYHNKTTKFTFPVELSDKAFLSVLVGFIDGDGHITKTHKGNTYMLGITGHENSIDMFNLIVEKIYDIYKPINYISTMKQVKPKLKKSMGRQYSRICITNIKIIQGLKQHTLDYKLPILNRKWDKISMLDKDYYEDAYNLRNKVLTLYKKGMTVTNISKEILTTYGTVYRIIKKYGAINDN